MTVPARPPRRSCDGLGLCQAQFDAERTRCPGCSYPYAPGTIEVHRRPSPFGKQFWLLALAGVVRFGPIAAAFGLLLGAMHSRGWL